MGDGLSSRLASLRWPAEKRQLFFAERRLERDAERVLANCMGDHSRTWPDAKMLRTDDINSDEVQNSCRT